MTDELLMKFLLKEASKAESSLVQDWLADAPANQAHYAQLEKIWQAGKVLATKSSVDEELAWIKFKEKATAIDAEVSVIRPINPSYNWLKIAAVIALMVGVWMVYNLLRPTAYTEVIAGNKVSIEKLADGSELTLNKYAELSYAANFKTQRSIRLKKGNVFFKVIPDSQNPFIIEVGKTMVTVVGTSFNISHLNNKTEVIVETGIVTVATAHEKIKLQKGEKAMISGPAAKLKKEQNTDRLYNYYRSRLFVANNIPVSKLVAALNEAYGAQIAISESAGRETITTTLKQENSLDYNIEKLCETMGLTVTRNQDQILLSKIK